MIIIRQPYITKIIFFVIIKITIIYEEIKKNFKFLVEIL